ncbi:hypothetical protein [Capnocytophaga sp.]|uniref:hypothetical protein n=1 Tax=Capnocytophaga sp. TaxID=44737 RepID=UPI0026DD5308|nr:hypothetical protein [Capnocytophaga sp.]MDO5105757.1 hypothetical protein [Capnocytophaga sp.]
MSKSELKQAIIDFEDGKTSADETLHKIKQISRQEIDLQRLENYWQAISLNDFCDELLSQPIENWQEITDNQALMLIDEILENIDSDVIINRNSEALEKKYTKEDGFVTELIFGLDMDNPTEILKELKKDTILHL